MRNISILTFFPIIIATGCGGSPKPHDSSVAEHERIAQQHDREAAGVEDRCAKARQSQLTTPAGGDAGPCWTAADKRFVDAHRDAAAKHRAASAALQAAESQACVGISEDDRALSPFDHAEDIASVEPFVMQVPTGKSTSYHRDVGAVVTFRAVPGLTAEWLQREIDCHLARNAALGHVVPEMPDCPLVPRGVEAHVRSTGTGFAVELRSDDTETAREILARAQRGVTKARSAASR